MNFDNNTLLLFLRDIRDSLKALESGSSSENTALASIAETVSSENTALASIAESVSATPKVLVVAGASANDEFTPTSAAFADALAHIADGGVVYLSYSANEETVYDMVVKASESAIVSAGSATWEAPSD